MSSMPEAAELAALAGAAAPPSMETLLGDFVRQNPGMAWLPQLLAAQRQSSAAPALPADTRQDEIDALQLELAQAQQQATRLQRLARRMAGELDDTRSLLSDLAAAFGACGLCWGEDERCPSCRGRGSAGRFPPDPEMRSRFIADAKT